MKSIIALSALVLLATSCATTSSDTSIRDQLLGAWTQDSHQGKVIENMPNGTIVMTTDGAETVRGKWFVTNGYIVIVAGSPGNSSQIHLPLIESNKVLSVSAEKAVLLDTDGQTKYTFHKQEAAPLRSPLRDASIRRRVVGAWESDEQPGRVVDSKSDGTYVIRVDGVERVRGNWSISNGYLIGKPSNDESRVESNKVVSLSEDRIVIRSINGHTDMTFHRK